jgi:hypothetical protein
MKIATRCLIAVLLSITAKAQIPQFFQSSFQVATTIAPTFSPATGYNGVPTTVTLSSSTAGSTFLYCQDTVNTCTPSIAGSTVSFSATGYIRAQATASGYNASSISSWQGTNTSPCFVDSFSGSGPLSSSWSSIANLSYQAVINQASGVAELATQGNWLAGAIVSGSGCTFTEDQYATATVSAYTGNAQLELLALMNSSGNGYAVIYKTSLGSSANEISKITGGSPSSLVGYCGTPVAGDVVKLAITGTGSGQTLTVYINHASAGFVAQCSTTDSTYTSGYPGVVLYSSDNNATDVQISGFGAN